MATGRHPAGLELTEEEAFALLAMCLTSPHQLDATSEKALRKLAEYCISTGTNNDHIIALAEYTASSA
jgi:predicted DNA-binding transcriptional regulator YafY